jgi:protein CpxP
MRKIVFILTILVGSTLSSIGQNYPQQNIQQQQQNNPQGQQKTKQTPEEKAQKLTQEMTTQLGLSQTQQQQIYNLNLSKINQTSAVKTKYNGDMDAAKAELKPINEQYKNGLKTILTPDQATKWEQIKQQKKQEHQQQNQSNGNGGNNTQPQQPQGQN